MPDRRRARFTKYPADLVDLMRIFDQSSPSAMSVVTGPLYRKEGMVYVSLSRRRPTLRGDNEVFPVREKEPGGYLYVNVRSDSRLARLMWAAFERDQRPYYGQILLHYVVAYLAGDSVPDGREIHHNNINHRDNRYRNLSYPWKPIHEAFHRLVVKRQVEARFTRFRSQVVHFGSPIRRSAAGAAVLAGGLDQEASEKVWWLNVVYLDQQRHLGEKGVQNPDLIPIIAGRYPGRCYRNKIRHLAQILRAVLDSSLDPGSLGFRVRDASDRNIFLAAPTVRRLLATLEDLGLVQRRADRFVTHPELFSGSPPHFGDR